jgi:predicted  nucleic acid-binding Zn-ribbon protein
MILVCTECGEEFATSDLDVISICDDCWEDVTRISGDDLDWILGRD